MAVPPKLSKLADACLLKLYQLALEGQQEVTNSTLFATFNNNVKSPVLTFALEELTDQGNVTFMINRGTSAISRDGYLKVENEIENANSFFSVYLEKGDNWLFETGGVIDNGEANAISMLAAEDAWEPLPLDRQNPALSRAIEKINELTQALAQDNGYAANNPDERNYILLALRDGVQALKDQSVIYRMQFKAFVWEPIKQIATRFGSGAIGVLADAAKELIKDAFKHLAKNLWN